MKMKYSQLTWIVILLVSVISVTLIYAHPIPSGVMSIFGPYNTPACFENDFGPNIFIEGSINATNTISGSDFCLNNDTLVEFFCGKWLNSNYFNTNIFDSLYVATINCSASNNGNLTFGCIQGECISTNLNHRARSNFFKNDLIAERILNGTLTYNVTSFGWISGSMNSPSSEDFGFKILNGMKHLGYLLSVNRHCGMAFSECFTPIIHEYQALNNLTQSDIVNSQLLSLLDYQISLVERRDNIQGQDFSCFDYISDAPDNEPSRNHLAFLYQLGMSYFPEIYRLNKSVSMYGNSECLNHQSIRGWQYVICGEEYWGGYGWACEVRPHPFTFYGIKDDYSTVQMLIHEHSHYIDGNTPITRRYSNAPYVNTTSFYNISYNISDYVILGWTYYRPRVNINNFNTHFFSYGPGWQWSNSGYFTPYEDFATAMEMYVLQGIVFRDYASTRPIFQQKYNWIKNNVFNGTEFNTGDPNYQNYVPDLYNIGQGIAAPGGIEQLRPGYHRWNY